VERSVWVGDAQFLKFTLKICKFLNYLSPQNNFFVPLKKISLYFDPSFIIEDQNIPVLPFISNQIPKLGFFFSLRLKLCHITSSQACMLPTPARLQLMLTHHTLFSVFIPIVFGNITLQNTKFKIFISILLLSLSLSLPSSVVYYNETTKLIALQRSSSAARSTRTSMVKGKLDPSFRCFKHLVVFFFKSAKK
jgi:hypothetical protein